MSNSRPRRRGVVPEWGIFNGSSGGLSPRMRGLFRGTRATHPERPSRPADAGLFRPGSSAKSLTVVLPADARGCSCLVAQRKEHLIVVPADAGLFRTSTASRHVLADRRA